MMPIVTVFGSGRLGEEEPLYRDAMRLGQLLGEAGLGIATGGYGGIMEAVLRGAAPYPVRRIGVVATALSARRVNPYVDELLEVHGYLERLQKLIDVGAAYVVFPGGTGTLLELFAVWALRERQLLPDKPLICLGAAWHKFVQDMSESFPEIAPVGALIHVSSTPEQAVDYLRQTLLGAGLTGGASRTSELPSKRQRRDG